MGITSQLSADHKELTIGVDGRFDFRVYDAFRGVYSDLDSSVSRYVIDLKNAEHMDSSALGMLLLLREHAGGDAADIRIVDPQPEVRNVLDIANFEKLFKIK